MCMFMDVKSGWKIGNPLRCALVIHEVKFTASLMDVEYGYIA